MNDHDILNDEVHYEDFDILDTINDILDITSEHDDEVLETEAFLYLAGELDHEPNEAVKQLALDILTGDWYKQRR